MKKALIVSREYPPSSTTGMAVFLKKLIDRSRNFQFDIMSYCKPYKTENTEITKVERRVKSRYLSALMFLLSVVRESIGRDFKVVVGNGPIGAATGVWIKILKRRPLVSMLYDFDFLRKEKRIMGVFGRTVRKIAFRIIFHFSDRVVIMSDFGKREILSISNYEPRRIIVIGAGKMEKEDMDIGKNKRVYEKLRVANRDKKVILFVGVVHPKKGLEYVIQAMPGILDRFPNTEFHIVGPTNVRSYHRKLKSLVESLKLKDKVKLLGRVENRNLWPYYRTADLYVAPSYATEIFGIPCVEASSFGLPVVATTLFRDNGVVVHNKTGLVIKPKSSEEFRKSILKLFEDNRLMKSLGKNGKEFSKRFNWDKSSERLNRVLDSVIEQ